jgi:hypothetical protein
MDSLNFDRPMSRQRQEELLWNVPVCSISAGAAEPRPTFREDPCGSRPKRRIAAIGQSEADGAFDRSWNSSRETRGVLREGCFRISAP